MGQPTGHEQGQHFWLFRLVQPGRQAEQGSKAEAQVEEEHARVEDKSGQAEHLMGKGVVMLCGMAGTGCDGVGGNVCFSFFLCPLLYVEKIDVCV